METLARLNKLVRGSSRYRRWKAEVRRRSNCCAACRCKHVALQAHHVRSIVQILIEEHVTDIYACPALWDVENGVQLCHACHEATHGRERERAYRALYGGA